MQALDIFNELSEYIYIRINSCQRCSHEEYWAETRIHKDYDLWYVEGGKVCIGVNESSYEAHEGDFVLFYPDTPYHTYTENSECCLIYIHFDFAVGNNLRILNDFNFSGIISGDKFAEQKELIVRGYDKYCDKSPMSALFLKGSLIEVLSHFIGESQSCGTLFEEQGKASNSDLLQPVLDYVTVNINKKITIAELSALVKFSEKYFIRFFKSALGISPIQYVNQLKMNQARKYIYQGNYTVKQLADILGYSDPYSFSRAFKKHFKVSPTQFK